MSRKSIEAEQEITGKEVFVSHIEESEGLPLTNSDFAKRLMRRMLFRLGTRVLAIALIISVLIIVIIGAELF